MAAAFSEIDFPVAIAVLRHAHRQTHLSQHRLSAKTVAAIEIHACSHIIDIIGVILAAHQFRASRHNSSCSFIDEAEVVNRHPVGCRVAPLHTDGHILGLGVFEQYREVLRLLVRGGNGSGAIAHEK